MKLRILSVSLIAFILGIGIQTSFANESEFPKPDGGAAPIYCISPVIESLQVFESQNRTLVQFHILPLQRTHIWDDLEKAEALGYASVRVGGYEVPTRNLYLSRFRAPLWQVTQATIDITEFVYPGAKITASAFHKSDGHQKCHGETHTYVPYRYFETGRYSTPSGPLAPTQN